MCSFEHSGVEYFAEPINDGIAVTEVHGDGSGLFVDPLLAAEITEGLDPGPGVEVGVISGADAEALVAEFAALHRTSVGSHERALVEHVLTQLGDPDNDLGPLLDELCRSRWTAIAEEVA